MYRFPLALLAAALAATPVSAAGLGEAFAALGTCYARHYDDAHLTSHPGQRVGSIFLFAGDHSDEPGRDHFDAVLDFGFTLRDGEVFEAVAYCRGETCSLEGDMGSFTLAPAAGDALRLEVDGFIEIEGEAGTSGNLAESDDRVFLIYPGPPVACDPTA